MRKYGKYGKLHVMVYVRVITVFLASMINYTCIKVILVRVITLDHYIFYIFNVLYLFHHFLIEFFYWILRILRKLTNFRKIFRNFKMKLTETYEKSGNFSILRKLTKAIFESYEIENLYLTEIRTPSHIWSGSETAYFMDIGYMLAVMMLE